MTTTTESLAQEAVESMAFAELRRRRGDRPVEPKGWTFDKRVSLDTLIAIVGIGIVIGGPMFLWGRAMEGRIQTLEIRDQQRAEQEKNRDLDARDQRISVLSKMEKFDDQLTQLRIDVAKALPLSEVLRRTVK